MQEPVNLNTTMHIHIRVRENALTCLVNVSFRMTDPAPCSWLATKFLALIKSLKQNYRNIIFVYQPHN